MMLILASLFVFSVAKADPGLPFPLQPAPVMSNIEGTWLAEEQGLEYPVIFQFCKKGSRVQLSRVELVGDGLALMYQRMNFSRSSHRMKYFVNDDQFSGSDHIIVEVYYETKRRQDVVLRVLAKKWSFLSSWVVSPAEFMMKKVSDHRPNHCR